MANDPSLLFAQLSVLTGDLQPIGSITADDLASARDAILRALAAGQQFPIASPHVTAHLADAGRFPSAVPLAAAEALNTAVARLPAVPDPAPPFVYRRDVPIRSLTLPASAPDWANGRMPSHSFGPFADAIGREIYIDVFPLVQQWQFVHAPGEAPFLTLPIGGAIPSSNSVPIAPGSLWFSAAAIAPAAPASGYCGVTVSGGTLDIIGAGVQIAGQEVLVLPGTTLRISADVAVPTAQAGSGPGLDARLADPVYFPALSLEFSAANSTCAANGQATLTAYGSTARLAPGANAAYAPDFNLLTLPLTCDAADFAALEVHSDLFIPAGTAQVAGSSWAFPVTIAPAASLGAAEGAGYLTLELATGWTAGWKGAANAVPLGNAVLFAAPGFLSVVAQVSGTQSQRRRVGLWQAQRASPSWLDLNWPGDLTLVFAAEGSGANGTGIELLSAEAALSCTLDRPLTLTGARTPVTAGAATIITLRTTAGFVLLFETALDDTPRTIGYALENAVLLTSGPAAIAFAAAYDGARCSDGMLALRFGLRQFLPSLPDPYAANFSLALRRGEGAASLMLAFVGWKASANPQLEYLFAPLPPAILPQQATRQAATPGTASVASAAETTFLPATGIALLDVSSNADRFGVLLRPGRQADSESLLVSTDGEVARVPANQLRVFTEPAVQWEPVVTLADPADPAYPEIITYSDNFGPSQLWNETVSLVHAAPAPALDALVAAAATAGPASPVLARFTLPFGMVAVASMTRSDDPGPMGAEVAYVRPEFASLDGQGGRQVMLKALHPQEQAAAGASPGLAGAAVQLTSAVGSGSGTLWSVLDTDVTTTVNANFTPSGTHAQVPVTRIDLSGYGESMFSDWRNPEDAAAIVSQVRLDVIVGRTALEEVQIRTVHYPYAVRVVRTIVVQRANEGAVVRRDTGWLPVTDGRYAYPDYTVTPGLNPSPPIKTHPGVVSGARDIVNIQDTGLRFTTSKYGTILAAVRFDCMLDIEGVVSGGTPAGVPAHGQLGFVQLTDPQNIGKLDPDEYAELLDRYGPLGGNVDCTIDIGGSGQTMRLTTVGFGVAAGSGGPEFPAAAWGSPVFPRGAGQFVFARHSGVSDPPVPVDTALGVPLTRAGAVPAGPDPGAPYRFADPGDLLQPDSPASEYGIVHDGGLQRTFFPRPVIAPGSNAITSTQVAKVADPYLLPTSFGLFPAPDQCIPFPNANWRLVVGAGNIALDPGTPVPFNVGVARRTLADGSAVQCIADYSAATVNLAIDTSKTPGWSFTLANVGLATSADGFGEVVRITGTITGDAETAPTTKDYTVTYGGAFSLVQDLLVFLQHLGDLLPPLSISMTNSWPETKKTKLKAGLEIPLGKILNKYTMPSAIILISTNIQFLDTIWADPSSSEGQMTLAFDAGAMIPIVGYLDGVGLAKLKIQLNTQQGVIFSLTVMAGVGTGEVFGPFKAIAYIAAGIIGIAGDSVYGLGGTLLIKASVDLVVASASISVDGKLVWLHQSCAAGVTTWVYARLTVAINLTIAFVIDIDFEEVWEWDDNANGGPCKPIPSTP
jgi:hypothetical protein